MKMGPRRRAGKPEGWQEPEAKKMSPASCSTHVSYKGFEQGSNARPAEFDAQAEPTTPGSCSTTAKYPPEMRR